MDWLTAYKIPLGNWLKSLVDLLNAHAAGLFDAISWVLGGLIDGFTTILVAIPPLALIALLVALMRLSPVATYRWLATAVIEFFRGVPALVVFLETGDGLFDSSARSGSGNDSNSD